MADDKTIERIQQEVVSANRDKLYQATLKEVKDNELQAKIKLGREVQELEMKHNQYNQVQLKSVDIVDYTYHNAPYEPQKYN